MEGRQPKRRKDKYNPYEIYEKDGKYYVSFRNGEKEYKDLEIGKNVYEAFNTFELQDVSHMNVVDRHLEQSEIWDSSLYERIFQKEESVEDTILNKLETERLHSAIQQLSEIQRRRLMKYYFEDKNYEQIAQEEGCSFQMVAKSVKAAIRNLKKILRQWVEKQRLSEETGGKRNILIRLFLLLSRKDWGAGRTLTNSYTFIRHIPVVIVMSVSHINRYAITQAG